MSLPFLGLSSPIEGVGWQRRWVAARMPVFGYGRLEVGAVKGWISRPQALECGAKAWTISEGHR